MIIAVTGHRPPLLGGYGEQARIRLEKFARNHIDIIGPDKIITGMAQGWDYACAVAAVSLGIPFLAVLPFEGQELSWPMGAQIRFAEMLKRAENVITSNRRPNKGAYIDRDRLMVDMADTVLALWSGKEEGGTWQTVKYAKEQGKPVTNLWDKWLKFNNNPLAYWE